MKDNKNNIDDQLNKLNKYEDVTNASIRGASVGAISVVSRTILRIGSIIILARILEPSDFGLFAMASVVLNLCILVADAGLTMASTQNLHVRQDQLSALFWINLAVGSVLTILTIVVSPILSLIFSEPKVISVSLALSVTLIAIGLGAQHESVLRRKMRYSYLEIVSIISLTIGLFVGVISAIFGARYWALVFQQLTTQISKSLLLLLGSGWKPNRPKYSSGLATFLRFGRNLIPSRILFYLSKTVDIVFIGIMGNSSDLGLYRKAQLIVNMPISQLKEPLNRLVPASLSRLQNNSAQYNLLLLHSLRLVCVISLLILGLIFTISDAFVVLLLGDQWLPIIPLIRVLVPAGLISSASTLVLWILVPVGLTKRLIYTRIVRVLMIFLGVFIGWTWGIMGIAVGYSVASVASLIIEIAVAIKGRGIKAIDLYDTIWRPIVAAVFSVFLTMFFLRQTTIMELTFQTIGFIISFVAIHGLLPGGWTYMRDVVNVVKRVIDRKDILR